MKNKNTFNILFGFITGGLLAFCPTLLHAQEEGEDMTSRIVNPSFEGNQSKVANSALIEGLGEIFIPEGWTLNKAIGGWNGIKLISNSEANPSYEGEKHFDLWKSRVINTDFSQTIAQLPAGKYKLTAALKIPDDNVDLITDQHIYAKADIDGITYKETITEAGVGIQNWELKTLIFNLTTDQDLIIGAAATNPTIEGISAGWFSVDDFRLVRLGEAEPISLEDILRALDEKSEIFTQFSNENMPMGTYTALNAVNEAYAELEPNAPLEKVQSVLKEFTQAIKDAREGELLFDTLLIYLNKSADVPADFPNYEAFNTIYQAQYEVFGSSESTNKEFKESIAILRKAYEDININNMNLATQEEGRDASWLIENPKFTKSGQDPSDQNAALLDGWDINFAYASSSEQWIGMGLSYVGDEEKVNAYNFNAWLHSYVETCQEINLLPEGTYTLSADLNLLSNPTESWIYANSQYEQTTQNPAYQYSAEADPPTPFWQTVTTEKVYVGSDGYLKIGFYCKNPTGWNYIGVHMTNFKLTYYGKKGSADKLVEELLIEAKALRDSSEIQEQIMPVEKAALIAIIEQAEFAEDKNEVLDPLREAIAHVKECIALYPQVETAFSVAEHYFGIGQNMAKGEDNREFEELINSQSLLMEAPTTSRLDLTHIKETLYDGTIRYQFKLTEQATESNPVDVTIAIVNPDIQIITDSKPEGWNCTRNVSGNFTNAGEHYTGDRSNTYIDANVAEAGKLKFTAKQTLTVPNGTYILECTGRSNGAGIYLFANGEGLYVQPIDAVGNTAGNIWENANEGSTEKEINGGQGYGWNRTILSGIEVTQRSIEIGITSDTDISQGNPWEGTWLSADDFILKCIKGEGLVVGIEDVTENTNDLLSSLYVENGYIMIEGCDEYTITSLSGTQVPRDTQLLPGFYLVTAKGQTVKVMVK